MPDVSGSKKQWNQVADFIIDDISESYHRGKSTRLKDDKMSQFNPTVFVEHLRTSTVAKKQIKDTNSWHGA